MRPGAWRVRIGGAIVLADSPEVRLIEQSLARRLTPGELFQGTQQVIGNATALTRDSQLVKPQQFSCETEA